MSRPTIRPALTPSDLFLEIFSAFVVLGYFAVLTWFYPQLPETIPTHFDLDGTPNDYGSKTSVFGLAAILVFLYALLTILSRYPWLYNYRVKITEENALVQYREGARLIRVVKTAVSLIFLVIGYDSMNTALSGSAKLGIAGPAIVGTLIFGILGYSIYNLKRSKKLG